MDNCCVKLLQGNDGLLHIANALAELKNVRQEALDNLGVSELIENIISQINNIPQFDSAPTAGHVDKVVSSAVIYNNLHSLETEIRNIINAVNTLQDSDTNPTANSTKYVTSGGIYKYISTNLRLLLQEINLNYYNKEELDRKLDSKIDSSLISQVGKTGNYNDLSNKPNIEGIVDRKISDLNDFKTTAARDIVDLKENTYDKEQIDQFRDDIDETFTEVRNTINLLGVPSLTSKVTSLENSVNKQLQQIQKIWGILENITGDTLHGIEMNVSPDYFTSDSGANVRISVSSTETIDNIKLYINDTLLKEANNTTTLTHSLTIKDTSIVRCEATILGGLYTKTKVINYYNSFYLGAANSYEGIVNNTYKKFITTSIEGVYNITVSSRLKIFIIVNSALNGFKVYMNNFLIPLETKEVVIDNLNYTVYESISSYQPGNYTINIQY